MYVYVNTTEAALQQNFTKLLDLQERIRNGTGGSQKRPCRTSIQPFSIIMMTFLLTQIVTPRNLFLLNINHVADRRSGKENMQTDLNLRLT